ncbi:hypothetical protein P2G88_13910 [Aliiglaciecola sp. CAU 1673]|uniref:hypothetical protein n=1 Tax=Aliiglaciecola sp. CAU 1673 TaxID=3032595 RepID=UPI0023DB0096|nr:hypothetical protein [Aliiglaciecola sp. CAU 1673]MDF2179349.1 hypothetical protein [Aliiglaciecola sp. CAU 1673]
MYRSACLIFALLLTACSSIPLSTMIKMRNFDQDSLQTLRAGDIRSRMTLPRGVGPDLEKTSLRVTLEFDKGEQQFSFPLEQLEQEDLILTGGLFSQDRLVSRYTLRLSEQGAAQFTQMQQSLQHNTPQSVGLSVSAILARDESHTKGIMTLELKLKAQEDYFVLIDEYAYEIGESKNY